MYLKWSSRITMKMPLAALSLALPLCGFADTLYLCKAYSGGTFWASAHCSKHQALIEQIVNVPSGLPFDQQVQIGQQQLNSAANTTCLTVVTNQVSQQPSTSGECTVLKNRVAELDAMAATPNRPDTRLDFRGEGEGAGSAVSIALLSWASFAGSVEFVFSLVAHGEHQRQIGLRGQCRAPIAFAPTRWVQSGLLQRQQIALVALERFHRLGTLLGAGGVVQRGELGAVVLDVGFAVGGVGGVG